METYSAGFNPRTRESATAIYPLKYGEVKVSIHALVRVRQEIPELHIRMETVSIHALVRVRLVISRDGIFLYLVSIHALVRVRQPKIINGDESPQFQSTHS